MPITNRKGTTGGRGNAGMFIERDPGVCAAGIPSTEESPISDCLQQYTLQHEVDALFNDSLFPPLKPREQPPLRKPKKDMRFAGCHTDVAELINPPKKNKFEQLAEEFKETSYASYWKKQVGVGRDRVPFLPLGINCETTTFGKKFPYDGPLYEIVFPVIPLPDKTPKTKEAGMQIDRKYCSPPFDNLKTYGHRYGVPDTGIFTKCAFNEEINQHCRLNTTQSNYKNRKQPSLGKTLAPDYNNISDFGVITKPDSVRECLTNCQLNPGYIQLKKCLAHLNGVRKNVSKRYLPNFFHEFYLKLRYFDKERTGLLPNTVVYDKAIKNMLRFDASLLEPLLAMWNAFDGSLIKYKTFVDVLNYRKPLPDLLKVSDISQECIDFRTTYSEMVKPGQKADPRPRAGVPAGRYFDMDLPQVPLGGCKADLNFLPQELSVKACLSPSIMTLHFVNHRDLYCVRKPEVIRKIFKTAQIEFTDENFESLWNKAMKYHSQGLVCIESFRKAMLDNPELLTIAKEDE